jgi:hypothetical protein
MTDKLPSDERVERAARLAFDLAEHFETTDGHAPWATVARWVLARESSAVALAVASTNLRHKEIIEASPTYRNHTGQPKLCWCDMCAYVRGNVTEINATTLADAQAALARFKADAVREALWDEHCRQCPPCRGNLAVNGVGGCAPGRKLLAELERKP